MLNDQKTSAIIYKQLFTDAEWDAISSAMKDYADYGDEEANIADSIDAKISAIYNLTAWSNDDFWNRTSALRLHLWSAGRIILQRRF